MARPNVNHLDRRINSLESSAQARCHFKKRSSDEEFIKEKGRYLLADMPGPIRCSPEHALSTWLVFVRIIACSRQADEELARFLPNRTRTNLHNAGLVCRRSPIICEPLTAPCPLSACCPVGGGGAGGEGHRWSCLSCFVLGSV